MTDSAKAMIDLMAHRDQFSVDFFNQNLPGLPKLLGFRFVEATPERVEMAFAVKPEHFAPNGFLRGGSVVALADTACGYGAVLNLPETAAGFTTISLNSHFIATAREGEVIATATPEHIGRTTHVWQCAVRRALDARLLAMFRCSQLVIYADR